MHIKGLMARAPLYFYKSDNKKWPFLYRCDFFNIKFFPSEHHLSIYQKTYPFSIHYEYQTYNDSVYNIPKDRFNVPKGSEGDFQRLLLQLVRVYGSTDPINKVHLRRSARLFITDRIQEFFLKKYSNKDDNINNQVENNTGEHETFNEIKEISERAHDKSAAILHKQKTLEFAKLDPNKVESKYRGIFFVRIIMVPNRLNFSEYEKHIKLALETFESSQRMPKGGTVIYKFQPPMGTGIRKPISLYLDLKQSLRQVEKFASRVQRYADSCEYSNSHEYSTMKNNVIANPALRDNRIKKLFNL